MQKVDSMCSFVILIKFLFCQNICFVQPQVYFISATLLLHCSTSKRCSIDLMFCDCGTYLYVRLIKLCKNCTNYGPSRTAAIKFSNVTKFCLKGLHVTRVSHYSLDLFTKRT